MKKQEIRKQALTFIWGWATNMTEGLEDGELSDHFYSLVKGGDMTREEAMECQKWVQHEADILHRKLHRLKENT